MEPAWQRRGGLFISFWGMLMGLGVVGGVAWQTRAQGENDGGVVATVTVAGGDQGGKFFGAAPDPARVRRYYIAAEPELWDYAPQGKDPICGKPLPPPLQVQRKGGKIRYIQYSDDTFKARMLPTERLGLMGPVMRGVVGDFIVVTFLNRTGRPLSMHPHGLKYDKDSEGSYYQPDPGLGSAVGPGARFTYVWKMDEESGPLPEEPSSKGWLYHSHVEGDEETDRGLVGFLIVTDPKRARADGSPSDVDRELPALFMIYDESGVGNEAKEAAEYGSIGLANPPLTFAQVQERMEQGARPAINGYVYGNARGLEAVEGERVRWYLFGLGTERDVHTAHWHGFRVREDGRRRTDVVELMPASMKVADMVADNVGTWLLHCHVADHMAEGMFARFIIHPAAKPGDANSPTRRLAEPFLGLSKAGSTMELDRAEVDVGRGGILFRGRVPVFQAFSVFTQPIRVSLAGQELEFRPDRSGVARQGESQLKIVNAGSFGVIDGGMLEFEIELRGEPWRKIEDSLVRQVRPKFQLQVGKARHETDVSFVIGPR